MDEQNKYFEVKIPAVDGYSQGPAEIEVCASVGEFDGVVIGINVLRTDPDPGRYENAEVTVEAAMQLRDALDAAIRVLTAGNSDAGTGE
jgi:hypothetical protein